MLDKNITDAEIKKALECCGKPYNICAECPIPNDIKDDCKCGEHLANYALDLINRQEAEIEWLKTSHTKRVLEITDSAKELIKMYKAEAYKEFANDFLKKIYPLGMGDGNYGINAKAIKIACDKLLQEKLGEK